MTTEDDFWRAVDHQTVTSAGGFDYTVLLALADYLGENNDFNRELALREIIRANKLPMVVPMVALGGADWLIPSPDNIVDYRFSRASLPWSLYGINCPPLYSYDYTMNDLEGVESRYGWCNLYGRFDSLSAAFKSLMFYMVGRNIYDLEFK